MKMDSFAQRLIFVKLDPLDQSTWYAFWNLGELCLPPEAIFGCFYPISNTIQLIILLFWGLLYNQYSGNNCTNIRYLTKTLFVVLSAVTLYQRRSVQWTPKIPMVLVTIAWEVICGFLLQRTAAYPEKCKIMGLLKSQSVMMDSKMKIGLIWWIETTMAMTNNYYIYSPNSYSVVQATKYNYWNEYWTSDF